MRIAAIDVGTNSIHMIVAEVHPDGSFQVVDREKEMVRLGTGGLDGRPLTPQIRATGLDTLVRFKRLADSRRVDEVVAVATSAVREASNGGEFLAEIACQAGIEVRVISGVEEARLVYAAAIYGIESAAGTTVVVDIGGGSTEVAVGDASGMQTSRSLKLGVIRLTDRMVRTDPLKPRDERRLVAHIRAEAAEHLGRVRAGGFRRVIATSGTALSLGEIALRGRGTGAMNHARLPAAALHRLRKALVASDMRQRLRMPGLDSRRSDIIVAGAVLADTIVRLLGAPEIVLCEGSLREGLVLEFIARNRRHIAQVDRYPDIRRRSVFELGDRCRWSLDHAQQVTRLALSLFDQTRPIHNLDDRTREWLEYAALLHDIGAHISYAGHHKHSEYLILNGGLRGFEPAEIQVIALVARHHRRATPSKGRGAFGDLPPALRRPVRIASALLRLAECLDRSHAQLVDGIEWTDDGSVGRLHLAVHGDTELEVWAAGRQVAPLGEELNRRIEIVTGDHDARHADHTAPLPGTPVRRRGHRRVGQDDAARTPGQVAHGERPAGLRH
jgi:exopolyphosphatase/guanosine-5'-triphosphate,3'-diphosphate pyrophosphatase